MAEEPRRSKKGWTAGIPHRQIRAQSTRQRVCSTFPTGDKDVGTVLGTDRQNGITFQIMSSINYHRPAESQGGKQDVRTVTFEPDPV